MIYHRRCAEILHLSNIFVCWPFRGTNYFKHFSPGTFGYLGVERGEKYGERKCRGGLYGQFSVVVRKRMMRAHRVASSNENIQDLIS